MNNTAKQLVEQLGDNTELTIMADVVHGLDYEYKQLQQENKELKDTILTYQLHTEVSPISHESINGNELICNLFTENKNIKNILNEFEKWLDSQECDIVENFVVIRLADIKNKLQELKGDDK